jgi:hypothetical protein
MAHMGMIDIESMFDKKDYYVETVGLKWKLDAKKLKRRTARHILRYSRGVLEGNNKFTAEGIKRLLGNVVSDDLRILNKWLERWQIRHDLLLINFPEVKYEQDWASVEYMTDIAGPLGTYTFTAEGIVRDEYIDKQYPDKSTRLQLPKGHHILSLAILRRNLW